MRYQFQSSLDFEDFMEEVLHLGLEDDMITEAELIIDLGNYTTPAGETLADEAVRLGAFPV